MGRERFVSAARVQKILNVDGSFRMFPSWTSLTQVRIDAIALTQALLLLFTHVLMYTSLSIIDIHSTGGNLVFINKYHGVNVEIYSG